MIIGTLTLSENNEYANMTEEEKDRFHDLLNNAIVGFTALYPHLGIDLEPVKLEVI